MVTTIFPDPALVEHFGCTRAVHGDALSDTVKLVALVAGHAHRAHHGRHYAMARNLVPALRAAYDEALATHDVLVMPTVPIRATSLVPPGAPVAESSARAFETVVNTFDLTGHPATSVPVGTVSRLPVGMMIIGRRFEDATCLRVAAAVE